MLGQQIGGMYAYSDDIYSHAITVQIKPTRDVLAEVALTRVNDISAGDGVWGQIGITQVVSDSGVEISILTVKRYSAKG